MLDVILIMITFLALLIASYSDLKTREVPDWLTYGLIFSALGVRSIFALELGWQIIVSGIIGFLVCLILAYAFYYLHQWGGGDSKLLMGMGAIIGISYPFAAESFTLLWFFLSLLFLGAIYGLIWMGYLAVKQRKMFGPAFKERIKAYKFVHLGTGALSITFLGLSFFNSLFWPLILFPVAAFYLFVFVGTVEKKCFVAHKNPRELTEGDWLAEKVIVNSKEIMKKKTLEKKDLTELQNLKKQKKLQTVLIKEGIPFIPSFLFAYLLIIFGQDIFGWLGKIIFG